jgi:hypothetical protein
MTKILQKNWTVETEISATTERETKMDRSGAYNFTKKDVDMQELSGDNKAQYEQDLPTLLRILKDKYPYHDETDKDILYDYEIKRFKELYDIDVCPVLSCYNSIFWLRDPNGVIYMWSRMDEMMIRGGDNMKEALINFLFHQEKLCYFDWDTRKLIPIKEAEDEAEKWYEENKKTATKIVVTDELLKPLEEKKKGSKKGGKQKKRKNKR